MTLFPALAIEGEHAQLSTKGEMRLVQSGEENTFYFTACVRLLEVLKKFYFYFLKNQQQFQFKLVAFPWQSYKKLNVRRTRGTHEE